MKNFNYYLTFFKSFLATMSYSENITGILLFFIISIGIIVKLQKFVSKKLFNEVKIELIWGSKLVYFLLPFMQMYVFLYYLIGIIIIAILKIKYKKEKKYLLLFSIFYYETALFFILLISFEIFLFYLEPNFYIGAIINNMDLYK